MPAKRKRSTPKSEPSKAIKTDAVDVSSGSTYEKSVAMVRTDADGWPNGLASWPAVLRAVAFDSLLEQKTESAWLAVIQIARHRPKEPIDLSLLPAKKKKGRTSADLIWYDGHLNGLNGYTSLLIRTSDIIRNLVIGDASSDSFTTSIRETYYQHLIGRCSDKSCRHFNQQRRSDYQKIQDEDQRPIWTNVMLTDQLAADSRPLYLALSWNRIDLVIGLLEQLPTIELDVFRSIDGRFVAEGPECWIRDSRLTAAANLPNLDRIFTAARDFMELYRRQRSQLLRTMLSDVLHYDLLLVIDDYGASAFRKT